MSEALLAAVRAGDLAEVGSLASTGVIPRGALPLAAERGPLELVELLIRRGAIEWLPDDAGRTPLEAARDGTAADRDAIIELLDRPVIRDPSFRAAVTAIQTGDVAALECLVEDEPRLLHERIREPSCYREAPSHSYFLDPLLLWFVADNPNLVETMPANIVEIAELLLARGASGREGALGLVMTSEPARVQGHQIPLIHAFVAAGAAATPEAIDVALAHRELDAVLALAPEMTPSIAAATGRAEDLERLLPSAAPAAVQAAFALAVVNDRTESARVALDAGADVNAIYGHCVALHQAALHDDVELLALLIARGARLDIRDTMWNGTPHGWAIHEHRPLAAAYLEKAAAEQRLHEG